jgi:hypothetical protein
VIWPLRALATIANIVLLLVGFAVAFTPLLFVGVLHFAAVGLHLLGHVTTEYVTIPALDGFISLGRWANSRRR